MAPALRRDSRGMPRAVQSTRTEGMRRGLRQLFTGQSVVGGTGSRNGQKAARPELVSQAIPSAGRTLPRLFRARTAPAALRTSITMRSPQSPSSDHAPISSRPITPNSLRQMQRTTSLPQQTAHGSTRFFVGVDPEEQHLAELATRSRRRIARRARNGQKNRSCTINFSDKRIRSKFIACCLSAMLLLTVLTIYLALALSNREESQEFHVLLILIILVTTIFFCHSLISLCMLAIRATDDEERLRISLVGPGGYANPLRPIRVALARDEEAVGIDSEATKIPPPAYGLWRESVRVDPDRIYWQRNDFSGLHRLPTPVEDAPSEASGVPRPPSYISDDGVNYVLETEPRIYGPNS